MSEVVFDVDARREFLDAVAYYESCEPGLGKRFHQAVVSATQRIQTMPLNYRVIHTPFRRCMVSHFPYGLLYTIEPEYIVIIAVAHAKRKPGYWMERVNE